MIEVADRTLSKIENVCAAIAAIGIAAIMLIVASDVALRYAFGRPWSWSYDFVGNYLTVAIFYLALPRTMREHGHINVDLIHEAMGFRVRHIVDVLVCLLSTGFFALLAIIFATLTWTQYVSEDVISSVIDWPVWMSTVLVPIGSGLIAMRLLVFMLWHLRALRTGVEQRALVVVHNVISTGE